MKKNITKEEQSYINSLLDKRRQKTTKKIVDGRERLADYEWETTVARNGMTYLEIEQLNNTYNNFR